MRVRVLKSLTGVVDGIPLSPLIPGFIYDLPHQTAEQLIEMRGVRPVRSSDMPTVEELEDIDIACVSGGVHVLQSDTAHDRPPRRRPQRASKRTSR